MRRAFRLVLLTITAAAIVSGTNLTFGQSFPTKPIRIIVPFPAGGTTDIFARYIAPKLSENLGQQVIIDNRAGASGMIGTEMLVKAPPDGYTLMITATHHVANPSLYKKLPYDTAKDITNITLVATAPNALLAHPSFPPNTIKELIALAKRKPGELNFASTGIGGNNHLSGELLKSMAGIDMLHIPYKGAAPALNDLLGGQVSMMFDALGAALPHFKAGKLKILGVTTLKRSPVVPEIPAISETVPGYEASSWFGMYGPAGMSKEILHRINNEVAKVLNSPDVKKRFAAFPAETGGNSPEEFDAYVKAEIIKWGMVIKKIGLTLD